MQHLSGDSARDCAKKYFNESYSTIMSLFGAIAIQIEVEKPDLDDMQVSSLAAYYTVVSHLELNNVPYVHLIQTFINNNEEQDLGNFGKELAYQLLIENKIHVLEVHGLIKVVRLQNGTRKLSLTKKGRESSVNPDDLLGEH